MSYRLVDLRLLLVLVVGVAALFGVAPSPSSAAGEQNPISAAALKHVGTHGGQCWTFMQQVVAEATGRRVGNDYRTGYFEAGAVEVSASEAAAGDIIQIADDRDTSAWASYRGLHTAIVLENLGSGRFDAIDSNQNWDEMVRLRPVYEPYALAAANGLDVHIYRIPLTGAGMPAAAVTFAKGDGATVAPDSGCLNMRGEPSLKGTIVTCLKAGTTAAVIDGPVVADGYTWVKVEAAGKSGWVAARYLAKATAPAAAAAVEPSPPAAAAPVVEDAPPVAKEAAAVLARVDNSPGCLRVRKEAGIGGGIVDCLPAATSVTIVDGPVDADGHAWVKVVVEGRATGWVASTFLLP